MSRNRFQKDMHIEFRGREYVIESRLPNGDFRMRDVAFDESRTVGEAELVDALFDNQLMFIGDVKMMVAQREAVKLLIDDLGVLEDDDPRKVEAKRRWAYVKTIIN